MNQVGPAKELEFPRLDIYQSFLGLEQRKHVSPLALAYDVSDNTSPDSREYELFKKIHASRGADQKPWGLLSWKFEHKTLVSLENYLAFAARKLDEGYDCVFINPMVGNEALYKNVWEQGAIVHPELAKIGNFLWQKFPVVINGISGIETFAFCNYFIARPKFWLRYFEFIDSIAQLLNQEERMGSEVGQVWSGPGQYQRDPGVKMRPFVIERLFSSLLINDRNLNACAYVHERHHYHQKFGLQLGETLANLSVLKNRGLAEANLQVLGDWNEIRRQLLKSDLRRLFGSLDDPPAIFLHPRLLSLNKELSKPGGAWRG